MARSAPGTKKNTKQSKAVTNPKQTATKHRSFRLSAKQPKPVADKKLPNSWQLLKRSLSLVWQYKKLFGGLVAIHILLVAVLALDPTGSTSNIFNTVLLVVFSMAAIWVIRHAIAGEKTTVKQALYHGPAAIVPFVLMGLLLSVQLIPLAVGLWLFQVVVGGGIAVHLAEQAIFLLIMLILVLISWYWVATSIVALYIVTLPDINPMHAWHTAKRLVDGRRALIARKGLVLIIISAVVAYLLILPIPEVWLVEYNVLAIISALLLPFMHTFGYKLYRSLV